MIRFEQEGRPCPVCGSTEARVFVEARFEPSELDSMSFSSRKVPEGLYHRLLECESCDLLYASPVPTVESLTDAYREADYASSEEARYAAATYGEVLRTITPLLPDLRGAADIGAGDGAFLERLRAAGFLETVGFEPSAAPLAAAPPSVRSRSAPSRSARASCRTSRSRSSAACRRSSTCSTLSRSAATPRGRSRPGARC